MYLIDNLLNTRKEIDNKWVIGRPVPFRTVRRTLKDIWLIITGKGEVVTFYKQ